MIEYVVESGRVVKKNGRWNADRMCQKGKWKFDDIERAREKLAEIDPRVAFRLERWSGRMSSIMGRGHYAELYVGVCRSYREPDRLSSMKDKGYYAELYMVAGGGRREVLYHKQHTFDDEFLWEDHGEGWYRTSWDDEGDDDAVWCETPADVDEQMDNVFGHETSTHRGHVEWMGDDAKPKEQL